MRILCVVPARAGSKTVPHKNIKDVCGKPLVGYIAETVAACGAFDRAILSTDSEEIAGAIRSSAQLEVPFIRPAELARDDSSMINVLSHALSFYEEREELFDFVFSVQPTNPFTSTDTLVKAVSLMKESGCDSVTSVTEIIHYHPFRSYKYDGDTKSLQPLTEYTTESFQRKQDRPSVYGMTGAVFGRKVSLLKDWHGEGFALGADQRAVVVSQEEAFDIDTSFEMETFEGIIKLRLERSGQNI